MGRRRRRPDDPAGRTPPPADGGGDRPAPGPTARAPGRAPRLYRRRRHPAACAAAGLGRGRQYSLPPDHSDPETPAGRVRLGQRRARHPVGGGPQTRRGRWGDAADRTVVAVVHVRARPANPRGRLPPAPQRGCRPADRRTPDSPVGRAGERRQYQAFVARVFAGRGKGLPAIPTRAGVPAPTAIALAGGAGRRRPVLPRDLDAAAWASAFRAALVSGRAADARPRRSARR